MQMIFSRTACAASLLMVLATNPSSLAVASEFKMEGGYYTPIFEGTPEAWAYENFSLKGEEIKLEATRNALEKGDPAGFTLRHWVDDTGDDSTNFWYRGWFEYKANITIHSSTKTHQADGLQYFMLDLEIDRERIPVVMVTRV